ncbi:helix-turn-helix domain-containing protein [Bradyrhizobium sp. CIR3A]|uniref:helix-turn-helix domain-containing protein n=1 Tax=Bradyrhizobium sp. CIR3A TaxID=2663838 RepID=UPI00160693E9|nr:helix-turn-helix domain-containing protein [Bradyrhizobium sp. CIR3A]MBB4259970.1 biotin operon repressor [Bradyrhizobium sp. CIR3A]
MDWVDAMALDRDLPDCAFRVACIIGTHFGNKSGLTYVSQETIAGVGGLSLATVQRAVKALEAAGYLIVRRRDVGERKDGRRVYGGRGTANEYLPAIDAGQISVTDRGQRLAARARSFWDDRSAKKHITGDVLSDGKQLTGDVLSAQQSTSLEPRKHLTGDVPTLNLPSEGNSSRARAPSVADALGPLAAIIVQARGEAEFKAWFGLAAIAAETPDCLTISLPSRFILSEVGKRYGDKLLRWLQLVDQGKRQVELVLRSAPAETAALPVAPRPKPIQEANVEAVQNVTRLGELMMRRARGAP